jgi:hypothetical protein
VVAYLLFCILCVLLIPLVGSFVLWLWLGVAGFVICWSIIRDVFHVLYRAWDRATTDKES